MKGPQEKSDLQESDQKKQEELIEKGEIKRMRRLVLSRLCGRDGEAGWNMLVTYEEAALVCLSLVQCEYKKDKQMEFYTIIQTFMVSEA